MSPREAFPAAKAAATKALELDDALAEAHAALGYADLYFDWKWTSAEQEFKRAIKLNPNSALSHQRYSEWLTARGQFDAGIVEAERAQSLDPSKQS
jgi:Tfp pilus assembly protein PilF